MHFLTGDQNVLWDALIKLQVLERQGHSALHQVHSSDLLSRPPRHKARHWQVTAEGYRSDGQVNRWTAAIEAALFLGRMPISPDRFRAAGIDLDTLAWFRRVDLDGMVQQLTEGDWYGVSHADERQIVHAIPAQEALSAFQQLRKRIRDDLIDSIVGADTRCFEHLFNVAAFQKAALGPAFAAIVRRELERFGCYQVSVLTTFDTHSATQPLSRMLHHFVHHYPVARAAYNVAVSHTDATERINVLPEGALPFYAVVGQSRLSRVDLAYVPGDSPGAIVERIAREHGVVHAVLGKAMLLLADLRLQGPVLLPENGSLYASESVRFCDNFERGIGRSLGFHPIYRLRLNALDALKGLCTEVRLPPYLAAAFGQERITVDRIGQDWRSVLENARLELATRYSGREWRSLLETLRHEGIVSTATANFYEDAIVRHEAYERELREVSQIGNAGMSHAASQDDRRAVQREAAVKRALIRAQYSAQDIDSWFAAATAAIDQHRAEKVRDLLSVQSLEYWNARPFTYWVHAVPGWFDRIAETASIEADALTSADNVSW